MSKQSKKKQRKKISGDVIFGISLIVIFVGLMSVFLLNLDKFKSDDAETTSISPYASAEAVDIDIEGRAYLGSEKAPVTIVEYGDYKCSHCQQFDSSVFPDIKEKLIETGKVKFVYKDYAFLNEDSITAAAYSNAVYETLGNEAYWEFHSRLFEKQKNQYATGAAATTDIIFNEKTLKSLVKSLFGKKEAAQVSTAYELYKDKYTKIVEADIEEAITNGVTGTPSVFLDGKRLTDSYNVEVMEGLVEGITSENNK